jgi:prevent-host-death family protein
MRSWLVKDARAHFSDVIDGALRGEPQRVSRRGKGAVVVVSEEEWARLAKPAPKLTAEEWQEIAPARHRQRRDPFEGTD